MNNDDLTERLHWFADLCRTLDLDTTGVEWIADNLDNLIDPMDKPDPMDTP